MRVLNKANQKNVILNKDYYAVEDIKRLLVNRKVFDLDEVTNSIKGKEYDNDFMRMSDHKIMEELDLRVFLNKGGELKVILHEDGYYTTVYEEDNIQYFVIL